MGELDINVTISQELRDIVTGHISSSHLGSPSRSVPKKRATAGKNEASANRPGWKPIILRRDASRPLKIDGMSVLQFCDTIQIDDLSCTHTAGIYVDTESNLFLALSFDLPSGAAARPLFRVHALEQPGIGGQIAHWCNDVIALVYQLSPNSTQKIEPRDIRDAFQTMTSNCFL
ncbi:MAG: hypothetical protein AAFP85_05880 [Pseudomonadota bacterium]